MLTKEKDVIRNIYRQKQITLNHDNFNGYFILYIFLDNDLRPVDGQVKRAETCSQFKIIHLVNK